MALTRSYDELIIERAQTSKNFRDLLLQSAIDELITGETRVAKSILKQYVAALNGLTDLASETKMHNYSIQRMLSTESNSSVNSLLTMLKAIQKVESLSTQSKTC